MGSLHAYGFDIRCPAESWSVHGEGARCNYCDGHRGFDERLCCDYAPFVRIIFFLTLRFWLCRIDRHSGCTAGILSSNLVVWIPVVAGDVYPAHRIFYGRRHQAISCVPSFDEYVFRKFRLVWTSLIVITFCPVWPANLVACALFNTLHSREYSGFGKHYGMSRERFFFYGFTAAVIWCKDLVYVFRSVSSKRKTQ